MLQVRGGAAVRGTRVIGGSNEMPNESERASCKIIDVSAGFQSDYTAADSAGCFLVSSSQ